MGGAGRNGRASMRALPFVASLVVVLAAATPALAAGPGDAPIVGVDLTLESGGPGPIRVEDDPDEGIPIVHITHEEAEEAELDG